MDETKTIAWQLVVEAKGIEQNTASAANSLTKLTDAAKLAGAALQAAAASEIVAKYVDLVNAFDDYENKLRLVTSSAEELVAVEDKLGDMAVANQTDIKASAAMYNELSQALDQFGLSDNQVLAVMDTLQKTIKLSGLTAQEAAGEMQHLAIALQSGTLSTKDVTALLRQVPELGQAIAAGMGVSIDKMKQLADQGKLTTQVFLDALSKEAPEIATKAAGMTETVADGFVALKDGITLAVGAFDKATGISAGFALALQSVGEELKNLGPDIASIGQDIREFIAVSAVAVVDFFEKIPEEIKGFAASVGETLGSAFGLTKMTDYFAGVHAASQKTLTDMEKETSTKLDLIAKDYADLHAKVNSTSVLDTPHKADPPVSDASLKSVKAFETEMEALNKQLEATTTTQQALNIQEAYGVNNLEAGATAAKHYTNEAEERQKVLDKIQETETQGITVTDQQRAAELARAKVVADAKNALYDEQLAFQKLTKTTEDYKAEILSLTDALAETAIQEKGITVSITQSAEASERYTAIAEAQLKVDEKIAEAKKDNRQFTDDQIASMRTLATETANATVDAEQHAKAWSTVNDVLEQSKTPQEQFTDQLTKLGVAFGRVQGELSPDKIEAWDQAMETAKKHQSDGWQLEKGAFDAFASDFTSFLTDGAFDFKKFATSIVEDIGKMIIQFELLKIAKSLGFAAANGAAFAGGNVIPMAAGGVVGGPTMFAMSGGRTGLMGEAGPEAVMPLARLPSGKLGVHAGGAPNIQIFNQTGVAARARIQQSQDRTSVILEAANLGAQMAQDQLTRSLRTGYGPSATAIQRTYALRRRGG